MRARYLKLFGILLVAAAIIVIAFKPGQIKLVELPEPPRDAPVALSGAKEIAFADIDDELPYEGAELRKMRNRIVEAWTEALDGYAADPQANPLRDAERIELKLLVARKQVGELAGAKFHAARVLLLEREVARIALRMQLDPPEASAATLREAEVYLARERLLAGVDGHAYGAKRTGHHTALMDRIKILTRQDPRSLPAARDDLEDFEEACPPEDVLLQRRAQ